MKQSMQNPLRFWLILPTAMLAILSIGLGGCVKDKEGRLMLKPLRPSTQDLIAMALDPTDADKRREGIVGLSQHPRGLEEKILRVYEIVALNLGEDPTVRCVAIGALGRARNSKYIKPIIICLGDADSAIRWESAIALDNVVGPEAAEPLRKHALNDPSVDVRSCAAKALRHYADREVIGTLARCMSDQDYSVRYEAHAALVEITKQDKGFDTQAWQDLASEMPQSQPAIGPINDLPNSPAR